MSKSTLNYFRFKPTEWSEGVIGYMSHEAQGIFMTIICNYWAMAQKGDYTKRDLLMRFENHTEIVESLFKNGLLVHNEDTDVISIKFIDKQLKIIEKTSKLRAEAGAIGGAATRDPRSFEEMGGVVIDGVESLRTVDKVRVSKEEYEELKHYYNCFQITRGLAMEDLAKKMKRPYTKPRRLRFGTKAVTQSVRLIREGIKAIDFDLACGEAFYDDFHQESGLKYVTPEYITRDNMFGKFNALSEAHAK